MGRTTPVAPPPRSCDADVSEIMELKTALKASNDELEQGKLKLDRVFYICRQLSEQVENLGVICMDGEQGQSQRSSGLNGFSGILNSFKDKIDLLEVDGVDIGSVVTDLVTMGGMIRRMKLKRTTTNDTGAASTSGNDEQGTRSVRRSGVGKKSGGKRKQRWLVSSSSCNESDDSVTSSSSDESDDSVTFSSSNNEESNVMVTSFSSNESDVASETAPSKTPPPASPGPIASTSTQAEQLSVSTSANRGKLRRSGRLVGKPRYSYNDQSEKWEPVADTSARDEPRSPVEILQEETSTNQLEDCEASTLRSGLRREPILNVRKKRKQNERIRVCPNSLCGKSFSSWKTYEKHLHFHALHHSMLKCDVGGCKETFKDWEAFKQHKEDKHGGGESNATTVKEEKVDVKAIARSEGSMNQGEGSSKASMRRTRKGAVGGTMLCTDGVTISVSRKRPKMEPGSTTADQVAESLNKDGSSGGEKGSAPELGSSPRVKIEKDD